MWGAAVRSKDDSESQAREATSVHDELFHEQCECGADVLVVACVGLCRMCAFVDVFIASALAAC